MKQIYSNHILSITWLMFLVFPNNGLYFYIVPLAYILLYDKTKKIDKKTLSYLFVFIFLFIVSLLVNVNETYLNFKSFARVGVLFIMFLTFGRLRGNKILAPYIIIAVLFLIISQFATILNITSINSLINSYYIGSEGESVIDKYYSFEITDYGIYRLGGIYFNSNNYASFLELTFAVLLCEIKQFSKIMLIVLIPLIIISIIATGSRTSFIVLIVIGLFYMYSSKQISLPKILLITTVFILIFTATIYTYNLSEYRVLKIDEGFDNSVGTKVNILLSYLESGPSIQKILFGNFSGEAIKKYINTNFSGTDFEIGNIVLSFGFVFLVLLMFFYRHIFLIMKSKYRIIFTILLWMFSNSILLSYRMAAVWMLVLGLYFHKSISKNAD